MAIKKNDSKKLQYDRIGITGCSGFVGSSLIKHLVKKNIPYSCFSGNLLNNSEIEAYYKKNKVNQIIHLVGSFDPPFENLIKKNLLTTQKLLEVGSKYGLKKIIYASSGAVYGEPIKIRSREEDILRPNTLYGLTKLYAEDCIKFFEHNHKIKYLILRFPNVYGPGNDKGVIYNFLSDIKKNGVITIAGDGKQTRNFLHVDDVCQSIEKALYYDFSNTFNISNDKKISINDLVKNLKNKFKFIIKYKQADNKLHDLVLDFSKAKKELNYVPKINEFNIAPKN